MQYKESNSYFADILHEKINATFCKMILKFGRSYQNGWTINQISSALWDVPSMDVTTLFLMKT